MNSIQEQRNQIQDQRNGRQPSNGELPGGLFELEQHSTTTTTTAATTNGPWQPLNSA
jgi:hypothetical protein